MGIVASREEIVGDPKLLGAGQEQQATGTGSNLLQQPESQSEPVQLKVRACHNKQLHVSMQDIDQMLQVWVL